MKIKNARLNRVIKKTYSDKGARAKTYISLFHFETGETVVLFDRLILSKEVFKSDINQDVLVKKFKDYNLYFLSFAIKSDTLFDGVNALFEPISKMYKPL